MEILEALTFDDVLLVPARSAILPFDADIRTRITRGIVLNLPIVASAMDAARRISGTRGWARRAASIARTICAPTLRS